jgi:hypothetical protein
MRSFGQAAVVAKDAALAALADAEERIALLEAELSDVANSEQELLDYYLAAMKAEKHFDAALLMHEMATRLTYSQRPAGELAEDFRRMAEAALEAAQARSSEDANGPATRPRDQPPSETNSEAVER